MADQIHQLFLRLSSLSTADDWFFCADLGLQVCSSSADSPGLSALAGMPLVLSLGLLLSQNLFAYFCCFSCLPVQTLQCRVDGGHRVAFLPCSLGGPEGQFILHCLL
jgi:hypothetical protein